MELKPEEMYDIVETYQQRAGDFIQTWGIHYVKGRSGKYHPSHIKLKQVYSPIKTDQRLLLRLSQLEIKELKQQVNQLKMENQLNTMANEQREED